MGAINNNQVPQFKGYMLGVLAANSDTFGSMAASVETVNQHGMSVFQDANGYINVAGSSNGGINQWYSQSTDTLFNFSGATQNVNGTGAGNVTTVTTPDGTTITVQSGGATGAVSGGNSVYTPASQFGTNSMTSPYNVGYTSAPNTSYAMPGTQTYQWGNQFIPVQMPYTSGNGQMYDASGDQVELSAADLQKLVDSGVYDSLAEAYEDLGKEYAISDEEQAKLGIYSDEDEAKIKSLMDTTGMTRQEAIKKLGDKIEKTTGTSSSDKSGETEKSDDPSRATYEKLISQGNSPEEALQMMKDSGTDITQDIIDEYELSKYSSKDQEKIKTIMENPDNEGETVAEVAKQLGLKKTAAGEKMKTFEATKKDDDEDNKDSDDTTKVDDKTKSQIDSKALELLKENCSNDKIKKYFTNVDELGKIVDDRNDITSGDFAEAIQEMKDMGLPVPQSIIDQFELSKYPQKDQETIKKYVEYNDGVTVEEAAKTLEEQGKIKHDCKDSTADIHFESVEYEDIDAETGKIKPSAKDKYKDDDNKNVNPSKKDNSKGVDSKTKDQINDAAFENFVDAGINDVDFGIMGNANIDHLDSMDEISEKIGSNEIAKVLEYMEDMDMAIPEALNDQFELSKYSKDERRVIKKYASDHGVSISKAIDTLEDKGKINTEWCTSDKHFKTTPYENINPDTGAVK